MLFQASRFTFCEAWTDEDGRTFLDDRPRYRYHALSDNLIHVVKEGETIWTIAGRYYRPQWRAAGLWWAIADFQPNPIHDPTIALVPGSLLVIPSRRTVVELVLNERRRQESRI
jgi:hypothetical protein